MPTNAELASTVASLAEGQAAIMEALTGGGATTVAEPVEDRQAETAAKVSKTDIPSITLDCAGMRVQFEQVYATVSGQPLVNPPFRVRLTVLDKKGEKVGKVMNVPAPVLAGIRTMDEADFSALTTDARS